MVFYRFLGGGWHSLITSEQANHCALKHYSPVWYRGSQDILSPYVLKISSTTQKQLSNRRSLPGERVFFC